MSVVISVENLSKYYRLGLIGGGTLREDVSRWWAKMRSKPDPFLKVGEESHGNRKNGEIWALRDISFEVQEGEILGIIGRNGAGKSTLLKILSRITAPTSGRALIKGRVGSLLEVGTGFHPELTGRENIYLNGTILGMTKVEVNRKLEEIVEFAEIAPFIDTPVKRYSSGMTVRLAFAVAAHLEPEVLIIDEVLAVGDTTFQKKCLGKMEEVSSSGRTILFVSHNMTMISALCSRVILLHKGRVNSSGDASKIVGQYAVEAEKNAKNITNKFPIKSLKHGLSIKAINVNLLSRDVFQDLEIEVSISSSVRRADVGIGVGIFTGFGEKVSILAPSLTDNKVALENEITIKLLVKEVSRYLSGGDYIISFWLSYVGKEMLINIPEAGYFYLTPRDVYGTGNAMEYRSHGIVPINLSVEVESC